MNILVVDDEKEIADLVALILKNQGYNVYKCYSSAKALECIENTVLDMAILDVMLPEIDGFELLKRIREKYTYPVILLTAKVETNDKIAGLSFGADDYITKPFEPIELLYRVKAQLRRYTDYDAINNKDTYSYGGLYLNKNEHICTLYDERIDLTPTEFKILWHLCENSGTVVSAEEIFEKVWKEKYLDCNNTVMVHIRRIREKLGEPAKNPKYIKTVWGVGYKVEKG